MIVDFEDVDADGWKLGVDVAYTLVLEMAVADSFFQNSTLMHCREKLGKLFLDCTVFLKLLDWQLQYMRCSTLSSL